MDKKICTICKIDKELDLFNKNKSKKDGLNNICKECSKERSKKYYSDNTEHHKKIIGDRRLANKIINQTNLFNYFKENPCIDCGNDNPIVLEFDHRGNKVKNVSEMLGSSCTWGTILKEINKCDVRCSNCHKIKTAKDFGWYKNII